MKTSYKKYIHCLIVEVRCKTTENEMLFNIGKTLHFFNVTDKDILKMDIGLNSA